MRMRLFLFTLIFLFFISDARALYTRGGVYAYKNDVNVDNIRSNGHRVILSRYGTYISTPLTTYYKEISPKYQKIFENNIIDKKCRPNSFEIHTILNYGIEQYDNLTNSLGSVLESKGYKEDWVTYYTKNYKKFTRKNSEIDFLLVKVTPISYVMSVCEVKP